MKLAPACDSCNASMIVVKRTWSFKRQNDSKDDHESVGTRIEGVVCTISVSKRTENWSQSWSPLCCSPIIHVISVPPPICIIFFSEIHNIVWIFNKTLKKKRNKYISSLDFIQFLLCKKNCKSFLIHKLILYFCINNFI